MPHVKSESIVACPLPPLVSCAQDRVTVLLEALRSFHRHIRTPFEVVIFSGERPLGGAF